MAPAQRILRQSADTVSPGSAFEVFSKAKQGVCQETCGRAQEQGSEEF